MTSKLDGGCPFGFRIVGSCFEPRRLVDAAVAFSAYASCDERAEIDGEAYLSAFRFGDDFKQRADPWGQLDVKGFDGACWSCWLWFDIDREDIEQALNDVRRLAAFIAERRGVKIGIEPHAQYSRHPDGLDRIHNLVKSPAIGINFDTGNAYLCGHDVYAWLERVASRLVHLHAKDIAQTHADAERGKVTGTPVGCACGEGVLDWTRIIKIVREKCPRDIVFSVECGTPDQAAKSLEHLSKLV